MNPSRIIILVISLFVLQSTTAQDMWKYFTPADFAARRAKVMEQIGDGIAIMQGAELTEGFVKFRQDNNFYYLTGVELPGAMLIMNGKNKRTTLLVPEHPNGDIKAEAQIKTGDSSARFYKVDAIVNIADFTSWVGYMATNNQPFYLVTSPEETTEMSRDRCMQIRATRMNDPWDGRIPKEVNFYNKIKERFPQASIKDLTPILDMMRWVKDKKEIAALRECGRIGALGFDEAMRVTRPGIFEYQVVAACDFVYQDKGAQCPAYFAIAASGERALAWHYNANNHPLKAGEVILLDYAPDLNYYVTDITRTWPVAGKFTEIQLTFYNCIKEAEEKVIAMMKPGITVNDMKKVAKDVYIKYGFEKYWLNYIGHFVGMAVHDVGPYDKPFVEGVVFNVEPLIEDKEMKFHMRLEDTIVITATGSENLTATTTVVPDEIYKLIKEKGIGER
ncbi:MAG: Xaa-Pro peptidase family protein [Ferruginibacter sp.]